MNGTGTGEGTGAKGMGCGGMHQDVVRFRKE